MAHGPTYRVKFRRRREGKTDYYRRRRMLLSRLPRLVVRKTNTQVIVQVVSAQVIGDSTIASAVSSELKNFGWVAGTANLPAAYLTGLLAARRAKSRGVDTAILDIGLNPPIRGSKVFAALKGALDGELEIPHDPKVLPPDERISGQHIVEAYNHFSSIEGTTQFSVIGSKKTTITSLPKKFQAVKKAILDIPAAELKKAKKKKAAAAAKAKPKAAKKAKPKRERPEVKAPRAQPRKPKPKKLIARGKGKKGKKKK